MLPHLHGKAGKYELFGGLKSAWFSVELGPPPALGRYSYAGELMRNPDKEKDPEPGRDMARYVREVLAVQPYCYQPPALWLANATVSFRPRWRRHLMRF